MIVVYSNPNKNVFKCDYLNKLNGIYRCFAKNSGQNFSLYFENTWVTTAIIKYIYTTYIRIHEAFKTLKFQRRVQDFSLCAYEFV